MSDELSTWLTEQIDAAENRTRTLLYWAQQTILTLQDPKLLGRYIPGWHDWPKVERSCTERLAELATTRRLIAEYERLHTFRDPLRTGPWWDGCREAVAYAMRARAEAYADQPGYRKEWRP